MKKSLFKMRRSSLLNSKERNYKKLITWLVLIFLALFVLRGVVTTISSWVTIPFFSVRHFINTSSATIPVFIREREEVLQTIRSLEQEVLEREGLNKALVAKVEENESLRALLSIEQVPRIGAGVIARPPHTPYDVILIDKGSDDGVLEHAPVFYANDKVLGYVEKVFSKYSLVTLISSPGVESTVYILGPDVFVTATGQGGGVIQLSVPHGISFAKGDVVITPSIHGGILGEIESIESNPSEPEQRGYLSYDIPMQSIRVVSVSIEQLHTISFDEAQQIVSENQNDFLQFDVVATTTSAESNTESEGNELVQ